MGPGAAKLTLDRVSLRYEGEGRPLPAVDHVSFKVMQGERLVLLGPSGCGKSTLLKAMAGFIGASGGSILIDGAPVTRPGLDRMMVFQEFDQLLPWKTVRGNVVFPMVASGRFDKRAARARADAIIAKVGLTGHGDAYPHTLSGGMKQRVAIARALALEPEVLLMDEPFGALDALTRRRMQDELLALWRELRFTLVFVTHAIDEAIVVGTRIVVLSPSPARVRAVIEVDHLGDAERSHPEFSTLAGRLEAMLGHEEGIVHAA
jgi:NitT/TauT family transport system ATP-binding protein